MRARGERAGIVDDESIVVRAENVVVARVGGGEDVIEHREGCERLGLAAAGSVRRRLGEEKTGGRRRERRGKVVCVGYNARRMS